MLQLRRLTFQKFLVWAFVLFLLNLHVNAQSKIEKKLNCRKFIFAPRCRGSAAKRFYPGAITYPTVNTRATEERNYMNKNRDSIIRDILLNYLLSRFEARSLIDNDINSDSVEDLTSYR